jgi:hypothetical protein
MSDLQTNDQKVYEESRYRTWALCGISFGTAMAMLCGILTFELVNQKLPGDVNPGDPRPPFTSAGAALPAPGP